MMPATLWSQCCCWNWQWSIIIAWVSRANASQWGLKPLRLTLLWPQSTFTCFAKQSDTPLGILFVYPVGCLDVDQWHQWERLLWIERQILTLMCLLFLINDFVSLPGCNKNHWQNSVEPNQPTEGELFFFLFYTDEQFLLRNKCIVSSGSKWNTR